MTGAAREAVRLAVDEASRDRLPDQPWRSGHEGAPPWPPIVRLRDVEAAVDGLHDDWLNELLA